MAIYTARYSNKTLREDGYYPVGISLGTPKFPLGYELREQCYALAPKGFMLKMEYEPYCKAYFQKLEDIGTDKIIGIVRRGHRGAEGGGASEGPEESGRASQRGAGRAVQTILRRRTAA